MGPAISVPRPTTVCDASTAFSIQYSGSGNASWDGQWVGLVDSPSGQVGAGIRPVSRAKAATFFRDPNQLLYSADLATMDYASVTESPSNCLLFAPSNVELPEYWGTTPPRTPSQTSMSISCQGLTSSSSETTTASRLQDSMYPGMSSPLKHTLQSL
jgi:hypothetical protein